MSVAVQTPRKRKKKKIAVIPVGWRPTVPFLKFLDTLEKTDAYKAKLKKLLKGATA